MSAFDDFAALLEGAEAVKPILRSVREEPALLLGQVCREYQATGQPVPDHNLSFAGYLGEIAVRALVSAELIRQLPGGSVSLYCYDPTPEGLEHYRGLKAEGFYREQSP